MRSVWGWGPQLWAVVPKERYGCSMASLLPAGSHGSLPLGRPHYLCFLLIQGIFFSPILASRGRKALLSSAHIHQESCIVSVLGWDWTL